MFQTQLAKRQEMGDTDSPAGRSEVIPVCGIGASAGGLEALQTFFTALPNDLSLAYVVVVHLAFSIGGLQSPIILEVRTRRDRGSHGPKIHGGRLSAAARLRRLAAKAK